MERERIEASSVAPPSTTAGGAVQQAEGLLVRRVGMKTQWRLAVSVGGFWLYSGRPDQKNLFPGASGLAFLSLASSPILGTELKSARQQPEFGLSLGLVCHAKSKSIDFFVASRF